MSESLPEGKEDDPNTQIEYLCEQLELQNSACSIVQNDNSAIKDRCELLQGHVDELESTVSMLINQHDQRDVEAPLRLNKLFSMPNKHEEPVKFDENKGIIAPIGGSVQNDDEKFGVNCSFDEFKPSEMEMKVLYDQNENVIVVPINGTNDNFWAVHEMIMCELISPEESYHDIKEKWNVIETQFQIIDYFDSNEEKEDKKGKRKVDEIQIENLNSFDSNQEKGEIEDRIPVQISKMIKRGKYGDRFFETGSSSKPDLKG